MFLEAGTIDNRIIGGVVVIIIVCVVAVYLSTQYVPPAAEVTYYKISGYVKTDGVALAGVAVTLDGKSDTTDSNGYYEFTELEGSKSYSLAVSKSGYESYSTPVQLGTQDLQVSEISLKAEIEMPLAAVKSAIATQENVSTDNVEVYFCVPSELVENENFAVGAVVNNQKSIVFIYYSSTSTIVTPMENEYTASGDALQGMSILVQKDVTSPFAQDHLGSYNVNKLVPVRIDKVGDTYTFSYYDGYFVYVSRWGFGAAVIDADGNIPVDNMTHTLR